MQTLPNTNLIQSSRLGSEWTDLLGKVRYIRCGRSESTNTEPINKRQHPTISY